MKTNPRLSAYFIGILFLTLSGRSASAVILATDNAVNSAYAADATNGAWQGENPGVWENPPGNDNGGSGFLPWSFAGGSGIDDIPYGKLTHYIDGVDFPTTTFNNLSAPSFALGTYPFPFNGVTTVASRPFAEPLAIGDIFSAEIDTPAEYDDYTGSNYPFAIIGFDDADGVETFNVEAGDGGGFGPYPWRYDDKNTTNGDFGVFAGGSSIAPTDTSDGSSFSMEVLSLTQGRFTLDGHSATIDFEAGVPNAVFFVLFDQNAEADAMDKPTGEHAFFFDNLKIEHPSAGVPGDYSGNGMVDAADYVLWRNSIGPGSLLNENGISPGQVDTEDYNYWRSRFGATSGSGSVLGGSATVPEPATGMTLLAGLAVLFVNKLAGRIRIPA